MPFPILKASGLYNSLYYRTSRDSPKMHDLTYNIFKIFRSLVVPPLLNTNRHPRRWYYVYSQIVCMYGLYLDMESREKFYHSFGKLQNAYWQLLTESSMTLTLLLTARKQARFSAKQPKNENEIALRSNNVQICLRRRVLFALRCYNTRSTTPAGSPTASQHMSVSGILVKLTG